MNGKPDTGKNQLYRIIVLETTYLIWKIRNKRSIRDEDGSEHSTVINKTTKRWRNTINKRLTIDCNPMNSSKFGKRALDSKLVRRTWRGCLNNKEGLPNNWHRRKGVLVGILSAAPPEAAR